MVDLLKSDDLGCHSMKDLCCITLAAGLGKRMGGDLPKAIAKAREKTLIEHVLSAAAPLKPAKNIIVVGHKRALVEDAVKSAHGLDQSNFAFALQAEQRGTGDAVKSALPELSKFSGTVLVLYADAPLVRTETLKALVDLHSSSKSTLTFLTFHAPYPSPYGRVVRDKKTSEVLAVVEAKDSGPEEMIIEEVNSGIMAIDSEFLKSAILEIKNNNKQNEFYLTDLVSIAVSKKLAVRAISVAHNSEALGVNTHAELAAVSRELEKRSVLELLSYGVEITDPDSLFIDSNVKVEPTAKIGPQVQLRGKTTIEAGVIIEGSSIIIDSHLRRESHIKFGCRIESSEVQTEASVGPFAHLRPGSEIGSHAKVGNFVETKNAKLAMGAKASHLTYLGDCTVGRDANIGAGTITCNYDGYKKSTTTIGERVFIGSNSALVAPVKIGDGATIGAGSVITKNVEADALALTRPALTVKPDWGKKKSK